MTLQRAVEIYLALTKPESRKKPLRPQSVAAFRRKFWNSHADKGPNRLAVQIAQEIGSDSLDVHIEACLALPFSTQPIPWPPMMCAQHDIDV